MRVSRLRFGGASLLVLLMTFGLGTSCGDEKPKAKVARFACPSNVDVNLDPTNGVSPLDIYVCPLSTVTWKAANGVAFTVFFKNHKCPFKGPGACKNINQDHPTSKPMDDNLKPLTVFDYGVSIDGELFDPHVVGGGG